MRCPGHSPSRRRRQLSCAGNALLEVSMGVAGLVLLSIVLLQLSLNTIHAQRWTVMQTLTDAYLSREVALGKRTGYGDFFGIDSPWPLYPLMDSQSVTIGKLPTGKPVTGTLWRTRQAHAGNLFIAGGTAVREDNHVGLEAWRLRSFLTYTVDGRPYVKARTVLRVR